jgi:hypothetical protein
VDEKCKTTPRIVPELLLFEAAHQKPIHVFYATQLAHQKPYFIKNTVLFATIRRYFLPPTI